MPELQQILELVLELGHDGRLGTEVQQRVQDREEVGERGHQRRCSPGLRLAKSVGVVATTVTGASATTMAADSEAEARMAAANEGFPGLFLGPRRRGKRGTPFAPLRFARRALKRRRFDGGLV